LCGDARKGNRPNFIAAALAPDAERLYERLATLLREGSVPVQTGRFGADMRVFVENDGPVTLLLEF
jgi:D-tyrosyl-tRNA(Tyr) deacylase